MYALYKKDKRPNQIKINYISYNKNKATVVYTISGARAELSPYFPTAATSNPRSMLIITPFYE